MYQTLEEMKLLTWAPGALFVQGVLGSSIKAKNTVPFAEHISLNSRYTAHNKYSSYCKSHLSSGSWKNQSCTSHGAVMEGKGSTVRFPATTHSKRSRSWRQGLEALQRTDVNRNTLPKILRVHSWSNSFQVSVVLADIIQREPNRLESSQSGSKERKVHAPENLSVPNYQSNLILVQNYILLH